MAFTDITTDELLDILHDQISSRVESWTYEGSNWNIHSMLQHEYVFSETSPTLQKQLLLSIA